MVRMRHAGCLLLAMGTICWGFTIYQPHRRGKDHTGHGATGAVTDPYDYASFVAYWNLDEAEGNPRADSKGSNDLSETGGSVPAAAAQESNGAVTDSAGNHYLSMAETADVRPTSGMAVACWVKTSASLPGNTAKIIAKGYPSFQLYVAGGGTDKLVWDITQSNFGGAQCVSNSSLSGATWYHVVAIAAQDDVELWVDGVKQTDTEIYDNTIDDSSGGNLSVAEAGLVANPLTIDELAFWKNITFADAAARAQFVADLYDSGSGHHYNP